SSSTGYTNMSEHPHVSEITRQMLTQRQMSGQSINNDHINEISCNFFSKVTPPTHIYTLSLHDALPILNCSRLPCVYAQETLTFLLTQKKTCVKNYVQKE